MKLDVTFEDGEPTKISTNEFGYVKFDVAGYVMCGEEPGTAIYQDSSSLTTLDEIQQVAEEIEDLPFIESVTWQNAKADK